MSRDILLSPEAFGASPGRWIVLDASVLLPGKTADLEAAFLKSRLPGARRLALDDVSDPETDLPHMAPGQGRFARAVGRLGITRDDAVLCTDRAGLVGACRAWWLFRLFGHARVAVLDGGMPAWVAQGGQLETATYEPSRPETYVPVPNYRLRAGAGDVRDALDAGALVLDARSAARFAGDVPEPRAGVRSGHMPGAVNLPYDQLCAPNGCFLPPDDLRARLSQAGMRDGRAVVTTCGSGLTASVLTVALGVAGYDHGALYDGSWAEWGRDPGLPVVEGPV